ncbi:RNA 2'-phosphotransferase [Paenibacillus glacialis]|uniref:RNA 2'-phosphotransferase n=1 Tax=Paenibacillus glacialis TaxID=494026 RepID=A0A168HRQ6_9BACL|nr:RNA 2'-phosphotransferase [Paenibacillus glacialis]OAB38461.1 hypothetical protein PGLA_20435 [Paenibacillus glacialis]
MDYSKLSKEVSYALRHAPGEYELELDSEGWVDIEHLLLSLHTDKKWESITESDLRRMVDASDKKRHEILNKRIRALYGHSVPQKVLKKVGIPPSILYHGTARNLVGKRKDSHPVLLKVHAEKASNEGIKLYRGNNAVWLADFVHSRFISVE